MKTVVGWTIECTEPTLVWVNGEPAKCEHRHRTVEAAVACISKRLRQGTAGETALNVCTGQYSLPIKVGPAKDVSTRLTVGELEARFKRAGLELQSQRVGKRPFHMTTPRDDDRPWGPHTMGTTSLQSIVDAINLGVV